MFGKSATELTEALVSGGERGLGDVGPAGAEKGGSVVEAEAAEVDGGAVAELSGEQAAEMRGTAMDGGSHFGEANGVGEMRGHVVDDGAERGMQNAMRGLGGGRIGRWRKDERE